MTPLQYFFLRLVMWRIRVAPQRDPVPGPIAATVLLAGINLMTVAMLIRHWWNWGSFIENGRDERLILSLTLMVGVGALQYRLWVAGDRLVISLKAIATESTKQRRQRSIVMWTYALTSIAALVAVVAFLAGNAATRA